MAGDLLPLAERVRALRLLRLVLIALALGGGLSPGVTHADTPALLISTALYAGGAVLLELSRHFLGRGLGLLGVLLLLDGVFLAAVDTATGGSSSPLFPLVLLHSVSVTLAASYRTGVKVTLWHSLLLCGCYELHLGQGGGGSLRQLVVSTITLWSLSLGAAVFSAVNERELRRRRVDLEALAMLTAALDSATTPSAVGRLLAAATVETADAVRVAVLGRRDGRVMVLAGPAELPDNDLGEDPVLEQAWARREPVLLAKISADTDPGLAAALPDARNVAILPMIADGQPVGALAVEFGNRIGPRVERRVVAMTSQFAAHAALALQNAWLLEALGRLASADPLTGLANRRAFNTELDRALARAGRRGEPVALVLLDVDHFKSVNDTWGHQIGDEVLRDVARALQSAVRAEATVARHGGEEFAVLLPDCGTGDALLIAERMRAAVGRLTVRDTSPITISVGVAVLGPTILTAAQLLDGADRALYAAKRAGRNRVRCADELPPAPTPEPTRVVPEARTA